MKQKQFKKGVVSVFIVIFTTLLVGIIALGFVRLMLLDQKRSLNSDLAKSAYDAALAGVEDAKRALLKYEREICGGNSPERCREITERYMRGQNCDTVQAILNNSNLGQEVKVTTSEGNDSLEQAYTCVKIKYQTDNYVRDIQEGKNEAILIPINTTQGTNNITLEWYTNDDAQGKRYNQGDLSSFSGNPIWKNNEEWGKKPPTLAVQFIQRGNNNMHTMFLQPATSGQATANFASVDSNAANPVANKVPPRVPITCDPARPYHCKVTLQFPQRINANDRNTFIKITKLYTPKTTINASFGGSGNKFNGIQPEIDVTGRSNYIFRRVKARAEYTSGLFPLPVAGFNVEGDICKSFEHTKYRLKDGKSFVAEEGDDSAKDNPCLID